MIPVVYRERVNRPYVAFRDRADAGRRLATMIEVDSSAPSVVLGMPRGGIPVGAALAERLQAPLAPVFARKLPVPAAPEMGFGAVALDGTISLNEPVVSSLGLSRDTVEAIARKVGDEIRRRAEEYFPNWRSLVVEKHRVYMVDDGLATGYTMMAAAKMVRKMNPAALILGVPVSPASSITTIEPYYDEIYCLIVQEPGRFAVASFYEDFHEMSDQEVHAILAKARSPSVNSVNS